MHGFARSQQITSLEALWCQPQKSTKIHTKQDPQCFTPCRIIFVLQVNTYLYFSVYSYLKIFRVTLCIMVTPILDSRTLTGAAFLMPVPKINSQAYCSSKSPPKASTSLPSESELRSQRHMRGRSDVIFRHISGSHMQCVLFLNARLSLTLQRMPHPQGYPPWYRYIICQFAGR